MIGVVLCGGESSRMGRDKGLLEWQRRPWAQIAFDALSHLQIPVAISVNGKSHSNYSQYFDSSILIRDKDALEVGGPLKGLLSVHEIYPSQDLFVLAVDMPNMHFSILETLLNAYNNSAADAFAFESENGLEPLCGIYTAIGLSKISNLVRQKELTRFSMHSVLAQIDTKLLPMHDKMKPFFANYNRPEDLEQLGM